MTEQEYHHNDVQHQAIMTLLNQNIEYELFALLKPSIQIDGNQWCILYGEDLQSGIAGFGDPPELAVLDFNKQWYKPINRNYGKET